MSHLGAELKAFIGRWLPPPPASVLDVGCGDGELTRWLAAEGYSAAGIDPEPPEGDVFISSTIEEFSSDMPFDAAVAMRSLHHVGDIERAVEGLHRNLRPHGRLVVFEFAVESLDAEVERWRMEHDVPSPLVETERHEVLPLGEVIVALDRRFLRLVSEPAPYLAREAGRHELEATERGAIETHRLPAVGARLAYERR